MKAATPCRKKLKEGEGLSIITVGQRHGCCFYHCFSCNMHEHHRHNSNCHYHLLVPTAAAPASHRTTLHSTRYPAAASSAHIVTFFHITAGP